MKKIFKCFIIFISFVSIMFALNGTAFSMDAADINTLRDRMLSATTVEPDEDWDKVTVYRGEKICQLVAEHNTTIHDHFRWSWELYMIRMWDDIPGIQLAFREYREYPSGGRGFVEYVIYDEDRDGIADKYRRNYHITTTCDNDIYTFVDPTYPREYINFDWHEVSREKADEIYEKVITYFLKHFEGNVI